MEEWRPWRTGRVVAVAALAFPALLTAASPPAALRVRASQQTGWIGIGVAGGTPGSRVTVREAGKVVARMRLDDRGAGSERRVSRWRCSQRDRRLTVSDGEARRATVTARTPDCGQRLALRVLPRRPHAGGHALLRFRDRWHIGHLALRICLVSPAGSRPCAAVRLRPEGAVLPVRAPRPGRWAVDVSGPGLELSRRLVIRPGGDALKVLAAGDSLMVPVAQALHDAFAASAAVRVRSDVVLGAGLSDPWIADWRTRARRAARGWKPDVVVLFLGGADGFPFGPVRCCGAAYQRAYGARARHVARIYSRHDAAQVYWLTLPAPRNPDQAVLWRAENRARAHALRGLEPCTSELDISSLLSPGFVFRSSMPVDGEPTVIRDADGVHLTPAGGRLVARVVTSALARAAIVR
jgi:lysophospholipase L1-like esterase